MSTGDRAATIPPGDRLKAVVRAIGAPHGRERSIKLRDQRLLANRFLLTVARDDIGADTSARVLAACERVEMPQEFRDAVAGHVTPANMIHFGYEEEHDGRAYYKVYLERGEQFARAMASRPPVTDPFVLFHAFKWNCADRHEKVMTRYVCHPRLTRTALLQRVAAVYAGQAERTPWHVVCEIVSAAARRVPESELLYLDVTEEGTNRKSFDVNFYRAGLRMASVAPFVERLAAHFRLRSDVMVDALAGMDDLRLGHVAGGVDRLGRDFLTIYFGAEAAV
jgi:hypothetical protein